MTDSSKAPDSSVNPSQGTRVYETPGAFANRGAVSITFRINGSTSQRARLSRENARKLRDQINEHLQNTQSKGVTA